MKLGKLRAGDCFTLMTNGFDGQFHPSWRRVFIPEGKQRVKVVSGKQVGLNGTLLLKFNAWPKILLPPKWVEANLLA